SCRSTKSAANNRYSLFHASAADKRIVGHRTLPTGSARPTRGILHLANARRSGGKVALDDAQRVNASGRICKTYKSREHCTNDPFSGARYFTALELSHS